MTKDSPSSGENVSYIHQGSTGGAKYGRRHTDSFDGNGGGGMEARLAKVESDVEYIKRDVSEIKEELKKFRDASFKWLIKGVVFLCAVILASEFFI
jgi:hypothetical protein